MLTRWHSGLVDAASVFVHVSVSDADRALDLADQLAALVSAHHTALDISPLPLAAASISYSSDARTAVASGTRAINHLSSARAEAKRLSLGYLEATPATVHFLAEVKTQARTIQFFGKSHLRSLLPRLHRRQFAACVPASYSAPLLEGMATYRLTTSVMSGIVVLYEAGVPSEYVSAAPRPGFP